MSDLIPLAALAVIAISQVLSYRQTMQSIATFNSIIYREQVKRQQITMKIVHEPRREPGDEWKDN